MAGIWIQHGDDAPFLVMPVANKFDVEALSQRLQLQAVSMRIGQFVHFLDAKGNSIDVDSAVQAARVKANPLKIYADIDVGQLLRLCARFWDQVLAVPKADTFKARYSRSCREICTIKAFPSLLWDGLESPFQFPALQSMVQGKQSPCCVLLDVSGAGKTRTLYELASAENCLFFGCRDGATPAQDGSMDLAEAATALQRLYPVGTIPTMGMDCAVSVVLLARLFLYQRFREYFSGDADEAFRLDWLFKQTLHRLLYYHVADPFHSLASDMLASVKTSDAVQSLHRDLGLGPEVRALAASLGIQTIVIDECQLLEDRLPGGFGDERKPSFLYALVDTLYRAGFTNVYLSGTGYSLFRIASGLSRNSSMLKARTEVSRFRLDGFGSPVQLKAFTERYVANTKDFHFGRLFRLYSGRYRFYVTALEHFLVASNKPGFSDSPYDFMHQFAKDLVTKSAESLGLPPGESIHDQVESFFRCHAGNKVSDVIEALVLLYFFGGTGFSHAGFESSNLQFVQCGLARLVWKKNGDNSLYPFTFDDLAQASEGAERLVQVAEPLVLWGIWDHLQRHPGLLQQWQLRDFVRKGTNGLEYEIFSLGDLFDGKKPTQVLRPVRGWHSMDQVPAYSRVYRLCQPKDSCEPLMQAMSAEGTPVKDWIDAILRKEQHFPTYLHSGPVETFGPDLMFMLETADGGELSYLLVLCQVKTGKQALRLEAGWSALDVTRLYLREDVIKRTVDQEADYVAVKNIKAASTLW